MKQATTGSMVRHRLAARVAGALAALAVCAPAASQEIPIPTFSFYKLEPVKIVEWKAVAQLGVSLSFGNTEAQSISGSGSVSRRAGDNKFSADAALAIAQAKFLVASEPDKDGRPGITQADEIEKITRTTTESWSVGARYDRFFAEWNSVYASVGATGDKPAGKSLFVGGQVGYRRVLYHRGKRELAAELGTDFTRREFVPPAASIEVISARAFVGYRAEPDPLFGITASVDALTNLNPEAPRVPGFKKTDPLNDNRVNAIVSTTVKLSEYGSLGLQFSAHYEQVPAPLPAIDGHPYIDFTPFADRFDAKTELVLIWRLL